MARINQGFLGNASGKLGNVVFAKWRRLFTARQYQPEIQDANSPEQQKQRSRMIALLEFLKPINKTFIRFYNSPFSKNSTPWAKAIKDNMSGVSSEGCFPLSNLQLGVSSFPAPLITEVIYNPFIDQVHFKYQHSGNSSLRNPFTYLATSVLGKYKTSDGHHEFDIRHLLCSLPEGQFWCSIYEDVNEYAYKNFWSNGRLWLIYYDTYSWDKICNPAENTSNGGTFEATPMLSDFNTDIADDLVPVDAFSWNFIMTPEGWRIQVNIDFKKTKLVNPSLYNINISGVSFKNNTYNHVYGIVWDLRSSTFMYQLSREGFNGSAIGLYSIYTKEGKRVSRFNRIYIDKGSDGIVHPYFQQLFDCNYSHPASFILSGNQCGFCGNIDEIFSDFIDLFEQGIITTVQPPAATEYYLMFNQASNGNVNITGYTRISGNRYYFNEGQTAFLETIPYPGFAFYMWSGPDAVNIVNIDINHYSLLMNRNMELAVSFNPVQSAFNILSSVPNDYGHYDISGYDHNIGDDYYFNRDTIASFVVVPNPGFVFSHWVGTGAAFVIQDTPVNFHLVMNTGYVLRAIFNQNV